MSLSRAKTIEKIEQMLTGMYKLLDIGKIKKVFLHEQAAELPADVVREGYQWLIAIHQEAYHKVWKTWKLCPEDVWDRYFKFGGFEDHDEVKMLRAALLHLKKAMHVRPVLFLKGKSSKILKRKKKS